MINCSLKFNHRKATQGLNFFAIQSSGIINKMKAIKLAYFADRYHLRKYGRPIFNDTYFAMQHGTVPSGLKDIAEMTDYVSEDEKTYASNYLKVIDKHTFRSLEPVDEVVFSESDIDALKFAWAKLGVYDQYQLSDLSHKYPEWSRFEEDLKNSPRIREDYNDFFKDPPEGYEKFHALDDKEKEDLTENLEQISYIESLWN